MVLSFAQRMRCVTYSLGLRSGTVLLGWDDWRIVQLEEFAVAGGPVADQMLEVFGVVAERAPVDAFDPRCHELCDMARESAFDERLDVFLNLRKNFVRLRN